MYHQLSNSGLMREEITKQLTTFSAEIVKQSKRVGQLETRIKYRQLPAPDRDMTTDDEDDLDDATTIEAEFNERPTPATGQQIVTLDPQVFFACNSSSIDFSGVTFHRGHS
jgi:hypothetical protein